MWQTRCRSFRITGGNHAVTHFHTGVRRTMPARGRHSRIARSTCPRRDGRPAPHHDTDCRRRHDYRLQRPGYAVQRQVFARLLRVAQNRTKSQALLDFDFSSIPTGAVVTKAELQLHQTTANPPEPFYIDVHRITEKWDAPTTTWNNRPESAAIVTNVALDLHGRRRYSHRRDRIGAKLAAQPTGQPGIRAADCTRVARQSHLRRPRSSPVSGRITRPAWSSSTHRPPPSSR